MDDAFLFQLGQNPRRARYTEIKIYDEQYQDIIEGHAFEIYLYRRRSARRAFQRRKGHPDDSRGAGISCRHSFGAFLNRGNFCGVTRSVFVFSEGKAERGECPSHGIDTCFISVSRRVEPGGASATSM